MPRSPEPADRSMPASGPGEIEFVATEGGARLCVRGEWTLAHHATLGIGIVGTNIIVAGQTRLRIVTLIAVAIEQRIDFCLRKNTVAHVFTAE